MIAEVLVMVCFFYDTATILPLIQNQKGEPARSLNRLARYSLQHNIEKKVINCFLFSTKEIGIILHISPLPQVISSENSVVAEQPQEDLDSRGDRQLPHHRCVNL